MSIVDQLKEMGFDAVIVDHAIKEAGSSLESAMDWILRNQGTFNPSSSSANVSSEATLVLPPVKATETVVEPEPTDMPNEDKTVGGQVAKSMKCDDCGKLFANEDALVWHASKTNHSNFSQTEEEIKQKTPEEIKAARAELEERIRINRKKREEKERQEEIEHEKIRRTQGRDIVNMRQKFQEDEIKRAAEERRREKQEDVETRKKILEQIARDREERRYREQGKVPPKVVPQRVEPPAPRNYEEAKIQIRMTDGQTMVANFKIDEPLAAVRCYVLTNRKDGEVPFQFMTTFPRKVFSEEDMTKSLRDLKLMPTAVLILSPIKLLE